MRSMQPVASHCSSCLAAAAFHRGMGWEEGRAIGRGAKEEVKAKELVRCGC